MIETVLLALIISKIKGFKLLPFFKSWTVYPFLILEILHLSFQIQIFFGNYFFIQFAPILKQVYLFCFIIPIIVYKEYFQGLVGSGFVIIGTILNKFVMAQNGGKMPVFPNFSYLTGYVSPRAFATIKGIHVLGNDSTRFWYLSDVLDIGYSVLSIGDIFIRVLAFLVIMRTVNVLNSANSIKNKNF